MNPRRGKGISALVGLVGAFAALWLGSMGVMLGVMGTDPCSGGVLDGIEWWLVPGYPTVLVLAALVPPILTYRGARARWVILSLAGIVGVASVWMATWFAIVGERCI